MGAEWERINDKMNRVSGNQVGFEFGPLALALSPGEVRGLEKNLISSGRVQAQQPLPPRSRAAPRRAAPRRSLGTAEKCAVGPIFTPVRANAASFLKILFSAPAWRARPLSSACLFSSSARSPS